MKMLAKTFATALVAAGLSAALVAPAFAADPADAGTTRRVAHIEVADLDLATPAGQRTLDKRIEAAARDVCRTVDVNTGTRIISREARACHVNARAEARKQVAARINETQRGG